EKRRTLGSELGPESGPRQRPGPKSGPRRTGGELCRHPGLPGRPGMPYVHALTIMSLTKTKERLGMLLGTAASAAAPNGRGKKNGPFSKKNQSRGVGVDPGSAEDQAASCTLCAWTMHCAAKTMMARRSNFWIRGVSSESVAGLPCRVAHQVLKSASGACRAEHDWWPCWWTCYTRTTTVGGGGVPHLDAESCALRSEIVKAIGHILGREEKKDKREEEKKEEKEADDGDGKGDEGKEEHEEVKVKDKLWAQTTAQTHDSLFNVQ
ncbi:hypothetical protein ACHAWF_003672, partial [Thalassiosira exigua]